MFKRKINHSRPGYYRDLVEIFLVPWAINGKSYEVTNIHRVDRLLPVGHRMRGDVGSGNLAHQMD